MPTVRRKMLSLIFVATLPLVVANLISVLVIGSQILRTTMADVRTVTQVIHDFIDTTLRESIVSYLRAKVETGLEMLEVAELPDRGLSEQEAVRLVESQLSSIQVAQSGYVYVLDDEGTVLIHPDPDTKGRTIPNTEPIRTQLEMRTGYLQYVWQNSYEPSPEPKALYMAEFPLYGWIVSATSYRDEFVQMVDQQRIADTLNGLEFDIETYSTVVARDGTFISHPDYRGRNVFEFFGEADGTRVMTALFSGTEGTLEYSWPDQSGETRRPKRMYYRHLPDFDWTVATTVYLDSLQEPTVRTVVLVGVFDLALLALLIWGAMVMSHSLADPIVRLSHSAARERPLRIDELPSGTPKELKSLVRQFNAFVGRIEQQKQDVAVREESLRQMVEEKTILIQEIHHRVKNNLQVIASLLNLQSDSTRDPEDSELFRRSADRVVSMALVHEQLQQSDNFTLVPFDHYLPDLVDRIREATNPVGVSIAVHCDPIVLEITRAVPCGLIVNELVVNAIEHGFPDGKAGTVDVCFRDTGEHYELSVRDTGVGMPDHLDKSLGMTLVESLADQLRAVLKVNGEPRASGTEVTLLFSKDT